MASHWLVLPALWLVDLNIDWNKPWFHWILGNYGLTWLVGITTVFHMPLTIPLHSPNGRPAIRVVQGDCERVWPPPINTWRIGQNDYNFVDDIFRWIFLNEYLCILMEFAMMKSVPIDNISAFVLLMAWCLPGVQPEPLMIMMSGAIWLH